MTNSLLARARAARTHAHLLCCAYFYALPMRTFYAPAHSHYLPFTPYFLNHARALPTYIHTGKEQALFRALTLPRMQWMRKEEGRKEQAVGRGRTFWQWGWDSDMAPWKEMDLHSETGRQAWAGRPSFHSHTSLPTPPPLHDLPPLAMPACAVNRPSLLRSKRPTPVVIISTYLSSIYSPLPTIMPTLPPPQPTHTRGNLSLHALPLPLSQLMPAYPTTMPALPMAF